MMMSNQKGEKKMTKATKKACEEIAEIIKPSTEVEKAVKDVLNILVCEPSNPVHG
jgi:BMFP domain-containing protein YqiC